MAVNGLSLLRLNDVFALLGRRLAVFLAYRGLRFLLRFLGIRLGRGVFGGLRRLLGTLGRSDAFLSLTRGEKLSGPAGKDEKKNHRRKKQDVDDAEHDIHADKVPPPRSRCFAVRHKPSSTPIRPFHIFLLFIIIPLTI